jgi:hypothetical protein
VTSLARRTPSGGINTLARSMSKRETRMARVGRNGSGPAVGNCHPRSHGGQSVASGIQRCSAWRPAVPLRRTDVGVRGATAACNPVNLPVKWKIALPREGVGSKTDAVDEIGPAQSLFNAVTARFK